MLDFDLDGHDRSRFIIDGDGPDVLVAIGCSWTRGWGAVDNCPDFDSLYQDDLDFYRNESFVGKISIGKRLASDCVFSVFFSDIILKF